jgi:ferric-dicitrate binding protein FerR (iron transport regulator)
MRVRFFTPRLDLSTDHPQRAQLVRALWMAFASLVCLQPLSAQDRGAATLEQLLGQVSLMEDNHPGKPLFVGNVLKAQQIIVTGPNSYAKFRLPDNSTFEVYENATVTFHADYGWSHLLNVIMGRVKIFIDHSKGPNSNSVTTPTAVISVRGTVFDVIVEDTDGTTLVVCDEGAVQVRNLTAPGGEPVLHPGDSVRIFRGQGLMGRQINKDPIIQGVLRAVRDAAQVALQGRVGGVGPGIGGGAPVPAGGGAGGAQGDKGKGGAAPPAAPPAAPGGNGH